MMQVKFLLARISVFDSLLTDSRSYFSNLTAFVIFITADVTGVIAGISYPDASEQEGAMKNSATKFTSAISVAALLATSGAAIAKDKDEKPEIITCEKSYGTVAITDGDAQGWSKFGLSSPRSMLGAIVQESGCFTLHNPASGESADYLMSAIAGSEEEIDQTMSMAKGAVTEGLVRSGVVGQVASKVPFAGAALSMFGGLGGKKKTISAGLRLVSPANGQTLIAGSGQSKKSVIKVLQQSDWVGDNQNGFGQYGSSKDGRMLTSAFIIAYNNMAGQAGALSVAQQAAAAPATAEVSTEYIVAIETAMMAGPSSGAEQVRTLRADTVLNPTGKREGLFVEVTDNYGTQGWVSVEDLR